MIALLTAHFNTKTRQCSTRMTFHTDSFDSVCGTSKLYTCSVAPRLEKVRQHGSTLPGNFVHLPGNF